MPVPSITYPLDLTGNAVTNRIIDEVYQITPATRAFVPVGGPFYTSNLIVRSVSTGLQLFPNVDYKALHFYRPAAQASGKEVCAVIFILDPSIYNEVSITYSVVGGEYSTAVTAIQEILDNLSLLDDGVNWAEIIDKPNEFPPTDHLQHVDTLYGMDDVVAVLEGVRQAILAGDQPVHEMIYRYIDNAIAERTLPASSVDVLRAEIAALFQQHIDDNDPHGQYTTEDEARLAAPIQDVQHGAGIEVSIINKVLTIINRGVLEIIPGDNIRVVPLSGSGRVRIESDGLSTIRRPAAISPIDNSGNVSAAGPLVGSQYAPAYDTDLRLRREFEVATDGDTAFASPVFSVSGNFDSVSISPSLNVSTIYRWRMRDVSVRGDTSPWSEPARFVTANTSIQKPSIVTPTQGASSFSVQGPYTATAFIALNGPDTHQSSDWQFATDPGFVNIVHESLNNSTGRTSYNPPPGALDFTTDYFVRVRYRGLVSGLSAFSDPVAFTTSVERSIELPIIRIPASATINVDRRPLIQADPFFGFNTNHASSTWQFSRNIPFTDIVHESVNDTINLTSYQVPFSDLLPENTVLYVRVRYTSDLGGLFNSEWSPVISFTTRPKLDSEDWVLQNSQTTLTIRDIEYSSDRAIHIRVGDNGTIGTSPDGVTWTPQVSGVTHDLYGAVWSERDSQFVVVGNSSIVLTSPDGVVWTQRDSGINSLWNDVAYSHLDDLYVAVGTQGRTMSSPDGVTWTFSPVGTTADLQAVTYVAQDDRFVAVGLDGGVYVSSNGTTWAQQVTLAEGLTDVTYGPSPDDLYVTVGLNGYIATSPDGLTWTTRVSNTTENLNSVTYSELDQGYLAVGNNGVMVYSEDGITWTPRFSGTDKNLFASNYGDGIIVVAGLDGVLSNSGVKPVVTLTQPTIINPTNGGFANVTHRFVSSEFAFTTGNDAHSMSDWQFSTDSSFSTILHQSLNNSVDLTRYRVPVGVLIKNEVYFVRVRHTSVSGLISSYSNPVSFRVLATQTPTITQPTEALTNYGLNGTFVTSNFTTNGSDSHLSTDWQIAADPGFNTILRSYTESYPNVSIRSTQAVILDLTFGNNLFVAVGEAGAVFTSKDGQDWTRRETVTPNNISSITYVNGEYIGTINSGVGGIIRSTNGIKWQATNVTQFGSGAVDIAFGNGLYVVIDNQGRIHTSPDGVTWILRHTQPGGFNALSRVKFLNGVFVSIGLNGAIISSVDAITWTTRNSGTTQVLYDVAFGNGVYYVVGDFYATTSSDLITWTKQIDAASILRCVEFNDGQFVAMGDGGVSLTSTNGVNPFVGYLSVVTTVRNFVKALGIYVITDHSVFATKYLAYQDKFGTIDIRNSVLTNSFSGTSNAITDIQYLNGRFVAVGSNGYVATSLDGFNWIVGITNDLNLAYNSAFGNGIYVTPTEISAIRTSTDALNWTTITLPFTMTTFNVAFGNNIWIVVGVNGFIGTSTDTINWTSRVVPSTGRLVTAKFLNGIFFIGGGAGNLLTSTDGINWTLRSQGLVASVHDIAFGNGVYLTVGNSGCLRSTDGINWTAVNPGVGQLERITFSEGSFYFTDRVGVVITTTDGLSFSIVPVGNLPFTILHGIARHPVSGKFVVSSGRGEIFTGDLPNRINTRLNFNTTYYVRARHNGLVGGLSEYSPGVSFTTRAPNMGESWTVENSSTGTALQDIIFDNTLAMHLASGSLFRSFNGIDWAPVASAPSMVFRAAARGGGMLIAVGNGGQYARTTDLVNWTVANTGIAEDLYAIIYAVTGFVAVGNNGTILVSYDGINWGQRTSGTVQNLRGIAFNNARLVACGHGGVIVTSDNDVTWVGRSTGTSVNLNDVKPMGVGFIAVGNNGQIRTSADGINWFTSESKVIDNLNGVTWTSDGSNRTVAVGNNGRMIQSLDLGVSWSLLNSNTSQRLNSINTADGLFVAVGDNGAIVRSGTKLPVVINTPSIVSPTNAQIDFATTGPFTSSPMSFSAGVDFHLSSDWQFSTVADFATITYQSLNNTTAKTSIQVPFGILEPFTQYYVRVRYTGASGFVTAYSTARVFTTNAGVLVAKPIVIETPYSTSFVARNSGVTSPLSRVAFGNGVYVVLTSDSSGNVLRSTNTTTWTQHPSGTANALTNIAFGNGLFVAVGITGTVVTSPDGIVWTTRTSGTSQFLFDIVFANGLFAAVGYDDTIITSPDGITWTQRFGITTNDLWSITFGNGLYVVVGEGGRIATSPDAIDWTPRTSGTSSVLRSVAFGSGLFVATSDSGIARTSPDGINWTPRTSGVGNNLDNLVYENNHFISISGTNLIISKDGINWTVRDIVTNINHLVYVGNQFVGVGNNGVIVTALVTDVLGTSLTPTLISNPFALTVGIDTHQSSTWQVSTVSNFASILHETVANTSALLSYTLPASLLVGNNRYFVRVKHISTNGVQSVFSDGVEIETVKTLAPVFVEPVSPIRLVTRTSGTTAVLRDVTFGNGVFVAVGEGGTVLTSSDGVTWIPRTSGVSTTFFNVTYGKGLFVAIGAGGVIITSLDGITWTQRTSGTTTRFWDIVFANDIFVAIGDGGVIVASSDGITWNVRTSGVGNNLIGITFGNSRWVIVGDSGTVLTSTDSVIWTTRTSGHPNNLYDVTFGNGLFVATGDGTPNIITSPDGITWTQRTSGTTSELYDATYTGQFFVAGGQNGTLITSNDGITWTSRVSGTTNILFTVSFVGNQLFLMGVGGFISTSSLRAVTGNGNLTNPFLTTNRFESTGTDTHQSTDWQFATDVGFTNVVHQSLNNTTDLLQYTVPFGALQPNTQYFVRVQHKGFIGDVSGYSIPVSFTTLRTNTPAIIVPTSGNTNVFPIGPFTTNAFSSTGTDTHQSTDWQFATDVGFTNIIHQSLNNTTDLITLSLNNGILATLTTYYVRARHRGATGGLSQYSNGIVFTTNQGAVIQKPTITAPVNASVGNVLAPTIVSNAFALVTGTDTHQSSDWQISTVNTFATIAHQSLGNTTSRTSYTVPAGQLLANTQYFVRVRYNGTSGSISAYSDVVTFTTLATNTPAITAPTNNQIGIARNATFTANAFSSTGTDTHQSSDWQIATDVGFTTIVNQTVNNTTSLTSYTLPSNNLLADTQYFVRVRYTGTLGGVSSYSSVISFRTLKTNDANITAPADNAVGIVRNPTVTTNAFSSTGTDTHQSTDWQFSTVSDFSIIAHQSVDNSTALTSYTPPTNTLVANTQYFVRARHRGTLGGFGAYGTVRTFTTLRTNTPAITAPTNNALNVSTATAITANAFSSTGTDTHQSSDWQIATDSAFTNVVHQSLNNTGSLTSYTVPAGQLLPNTQYFVRVRYNGTNGGLSAYSATISYTTLFTNATSITAPTEGQLGLGLAPTITTAAFSSSGTDTHQSTDWQISTVNTFATIVHQSLDNTTALVSYVVPSGQLLANTQYFVRARHRGVLGGFGAYSPVRSFRTLATNTPSITVPTSGNTNVFPTGPFSSNAFSSTGTDTHQSSDWQFSTVSDFSTIAFQSLNNTTALTSITLANGNLNPLTAYFVRVRHRGVIGGLSDYSVAIPFTTNQGAVIAKPSIVSTPITWTSRTSGTANNLLGITYANGLFVVTGESGTIITSPDAINWTTRTSGTPNNLLGITFANGLFVAVGNIGTIITSPDGITWTSRTSGTFSDLRGVTFANGLFVAVGFNGTIITSPDAITWTLRNSGVTSGFLGITFANGLFVAVGANGTIITSPDAITWTTRTSGTGNLLFNVTFANGLFVAVGIDGTIITSPDAINWTSRTSGTNLSLRGVTFANGLFVVVGLGDDAILTSPDAINWTSRTSGTTNNLLGITFANGLFVAVGGFGVIITSEVTLLLSNTTPKFISTTFALTAGADTHLSSDWQVSTVNTFASIVHQSIGNTANLTSYTVPNGQLLAATTYYARVRYTGNTGVSSDYSDPFEFMTQTVNTPSIVRNGAITWTSRNSDTSDIIYDIAFANGRFVAVGDGGTITTSPDAITWTTQISGTIESLYDIAYGNGFFVAVGFGGTILISPESINWITRTSDTTNSLNAITFGNGVFVAVGEFGTILTSLDGFNWTTPTSGTSDALYNVTFGNGLYVVVGDGGTIITSPDGINWTPRNSGVTSGFLGITFANGLFVAVGANGTIITSPNAITWTLRNSGVTEQLIDITFANGLFLVVGTSGTIITSPDGITWTPRTSGTTNFLGGVTFANGLFVAVGDGGTIITSYAGLPVTGADLRPRLRATDFSAPFVTAHLNSDWQIATDVAFTAITNQSLANTTQLTSYLAPANLVPNTQYYARVRYRATGGETSLYSGVEPFTTESIANPTIISPLDNATGVAVGVTITSSAFNTNGNSRHATSTWEVATDAGFTNIVRSSVNSGANLTSYTVTPDLAFLTQYFVRVRYTTDSGYTTTNSPVVRFTTSAQPGIVWNTRNSNTIGIIYDIAFGNGLYVVVGDGGTIITSPDAINWTSRVSGTVNTLFDITFANGRFVAVGDGGTIITSPDTINWITRTSGTTNNLLGITFANGRFVAVGDGGTITTSPDAITWTTQISGVTEQYIDITFANGLFVAVGFNGIIITSPDTINWTPRTSGTSNILYNVTFGNGLYVAVGDDGTILTSLDAINWTTRTSGTSNALDGIRFANGLYVAVGGNGTIITSPDAITWTPRTSGTSSFLLGITFANGLFVAVGDGGTILTSD